MRSLDVVNRTGATYRQLDYWTRLGLFSFGSRKVGIGSGAPRNYEPHQCVLARAFVLIGKVSRTHYERLAKAEAAVKAAWQIDPALKGYWLVIIEEGAYVTPLVPSHDACVLVSLEQCAHTLARSALATAP